MLVEYHSNSGDFGYFYEANARMYNFYDFEGYPSLFCDGVDLWPISTWRPYINNRINKPSVITLTFDGYYNPGLDTGWVSASFRNDSSAAITARVYFVITEDSLYHLDLNGHAWHNRLARDMLPNQTGETVTVNPAETVTLARSFTINALWNENRCYVVSWIQADAPSRDVFQAGEIVLTSLPGVEENSNLTIRNPHVSLINNPCLANNVRFSLDLPANTSYQIQIYDILGRSVKTITGNAANGTEEVLCNLNHGHHNRVSTGVYFYRFTSPVIRTIGKIVVR